MNLTQTEVYPDRNVLSAVRNIDLEPGKRPHWEAGCAEMMPKSVGVAWVMEAEIQAEEKKGPRMNLPVTAASEE